MAKNSLIDTSGGEFVIQEKSIHVTDEKLNRMLSDTYECARKDAKRFRWYDHYGVFFSIAGALIVPLLTSNFRDFDFIEGQTLNGIAWLVCVLSLIIGVILTIVRASNNGANEVDDRNNAVDRIMSGILNDENKCT